RGGARGGPRVPRRSPGRAGDDGRGGASRSPEAVFEGAAGPGHRGAVRNAAGKAKRGGVMRSLITGGAGFIGSHLADALLRLGGEVVVIDDLSTGSIQNIEHLKSHRGFSYHIDTIQNRSLMAELVD